MARSSDPRQAILALDDEKSAAPRGSLNWDAELRAALSEAIKGCGHSRAEIAADMEEALGSDPNYPISVSTLDAWTAPSRTDWRFPLIYLPAFIQATGATWLVARIADKCGHKVISGSEATHAELGSIVAQQEELKNREREIRRRLRRRS